MMNHRKSHQIMTLMGILLMLVPAQAQSPADRSTPARLSDWQLEAQSVAGGAGITVHADLVYASYQFEGSSHNLLLDLYLPESDDLRALPVLVFMHGGGWFEGSKDGCPGRAFAQNGYAMACVNYRLGRPDGCPTDFVFPVQIHDVKAAVRWLRQHADQYGLDPDRFGALGDSSGGHLAALLGTSHGVAALEGTENLGKSDAVQAVGEWFGPVYATRGYEIIFEDDPCTTTWEYLDQTYGGEETPYFYLTYAWGVFLGGSLADPVVLNRASQAAPETHADEQDPPFLILHGEDDGMVPIIQSEFLATALEGAGVEVTYTSIPSAGHGYAGTEQEVDPQFLDPTLEFFSRHLRMAEASCRIYLPLVSAGIQ